AALSAADQRRADHPGNRPVARPQRRPAGRAKGDPEVLEEPGSPGVRLWRTPGLPGSVRSAQAACLARAGGSDRWPAQRYVVLALGDRRQPAGDGRPGGTLVLAGEYVAVGGRGEEGESARPDGHGHRLVVADDVRRQSPRDDLPGAPRVAAAA